MLQLSMQTVVAGLIRAGARILIAQRSASGRHPLKWEFPGGKVEAKETPQEALTRELREELGVEATVGPEFTRYEYSYAGKPAILLIFFTVRSYTGKIDNLGVFADLKFEQTANLHAYDFLEGDLALVQLLGKVEIDQV